MSIAKPRVWCCCTSQAAHKNGPVRPGAARMRRALRWRGRPDIGQFSCKQTDVLFTSRRPWFTYPPPFTSLMLVYGLPYFSYGYGLPSKNEQARGTIPVVLPTGDGNDI